MKDLLCVLWLLPYVLLTSCTNQAFVRADEYILARIGNYPLPSDRVAVVPIGIRYEDHDDLYADVVAIGPRDPALYAAQYIQWSEPQEMMEIAHLDGKPVDIGREQFERPDNNDLSSVQSPISFHANVGDHDAFIARVPLRDVAGLFGPKAAYHITLRHPPFLKECSVDTTRHTFQVERIKLLGTGAAKPR